MKAEEWKAFEQTLLDRGYKKFTSAKKWLKEIKFKYCVHPVKQEWSEEDEEYLDGIRATLLEIEDSATKIDGLTESQWVAIRAAHRLLGELKSRTRS